MKSVVLFVFAAAVGDAQGTVSLPAVTVYSPRVANQSPVGTFATPVSALRYNPRVDLHARNLAEGQADVTIRGGIFENSGFQVGAVSLGDPQTGHYFAEIPIAPALLGVPELFLGADLALRTSNATVGAVSYGWREIRTAGAASAAAGEYGLKRGELYQGYSHAFASGGPRYGVDIAIAQSESNGSVPYGEHEFGRANIRLQRSTSNSQTDFFAGYQGKRFGWPNMYTPFNSNETENLQTSLFLLNHRATFGAGEFFEAAVFHRRNKDDYAFNRFAPVGPVHPFQHTTWVNGVAASGRNEFEGFALNYRAEFSSDKLNSTALTFGRFRTREVTKLALAPEKIWKHSDGSRTTVKAGATYNHSNRDGSSFSPVVELSRDFPSSQLQRTYFSYSEATQLPTYTALNSSTTGGLFRGNPNLGRETTQNVEVGTSGSLAGWNGTAALFWRRDRDLVDWTFRQGVTARAASAVDIDTSGLELVARNAWKQGEVVLGYTVLTKDADYRGAVVDGSFYALNYARHRLTAALTWRLGDAFVFRLDNVARIQATNPLRTIGGRKAINTTAGITYAPLAWRRVEISLYVDNLWDNAYQDVPAVPAAKRQVAFGLAYTW